MVSSGRAIAGAALFAVCLAGLSVVTRRGVPLSRAQAPSQAVDSGSIDVAPSSGALAPYKEGWLGERSVLARVPRASLEPGPVLEVDVLVDTAVILQPQGWWLARNSHLRGPFGTEIGRSRLLAARTIAVARDGSGTVIVLDNRRGEILFWDRGGQRLVRTLDLTNHGRVRLQQVTELGLDGKGNVLVTAHGIEGTHAMGPWLLLRYEPTSVDTLLRSTPAGAPGRAFATISASNLADGSVAAITGRDYGLWWFAPNGQPIRRRVREDAPRWRVSSVAHARIATILGRMPIEMRSDDAYSQPKYYPAVQQIVALDNGCVVVATVAGFSKAVYFEVLDSSGQTLGRLTKKPLAGHWNLTARGIVWARDEGDETVVEFQPFRIPGGHASH